jgi:hypothetical protein
MTENPLLSPSHTDDIIDAVTKSLVSAEQKIKNQDVEIKKLSNVLELKEKNLSFKAGWLTKRGHVRKNWKKRWFSLSAVGNLCTSYCPC